MTNASGKSVMLVEDDASMAAVLTTLLELEGYQVKVAPQQNGLEQILEAICSAKPDVLLLDVHLKNTNGYEIIQRLRTEPQTAALRVVMSSGMDVAERCMAAGADDFLLKPFMPDELMKKLTGDVRVPCRSAQLS